MTLASGSMFGSSEERIATIIIAIISRRRRQTVHILNLLHPRQLLSVGLSSLHPDGPVDTVLGDPVIGVLDSVGHCSTW